MPTQRTGTNPPAGPPAAPSPSPQPTGSPDGQSPDQLKTQQTVNPVVNPAATAEFAGRPVVPVSAGDLMQSHINETGNPDPMGKGPGEAWQGGGQQGNDLMPPYLREQAAQQQVQQQAQRADARKPRPEDVGKAAAGLDQDDQAEDPPMSNDAVEAINMLQEQLMQARSRGDEELAGNIEQVLTRVIGNTTMKRKRQAKADHPVFQRLKQQLGISKIQPGEVEWGGFKWRVAATPAPLDQWVGQMQSENLGNYSALKVSTSVVGIDGVPVYDILGIELTAEFEPVAGEKPVKVQTFPKECRACGAADLEVRAEKCPHCSAGQDPYDMPLVLRMLCAERLHEWFQTDFGPYEALGDLLVEMRTVIKDRRLDQEELYPFLKPSQAPGQPTDTSQSGAE